MKYLTLKKNIVGGIDATIKHAIYGVIPYTLSSEEIKTLSSYESIEELTKEDKKRIFKIEKDTENELNLNYLKKTDWYITRKLESGKSIPKEISDKRKAARKAL